MIAVNQNNRNSRVQEWNLQLERQLGSNNVVNVAYVGTRGSRLSSYYPYNMNQFITGAQNFPTLGGINYNNYDGVSNYDACRHTRNTAPTTGWWQPSLTRGRTHWTTHREPSKARHRLCITTRWPAWQFQPGHPPGLQLIRPLQAAFRPRPALRRRRLAPVDWIVGGWQTNLDRNRQTGTPFDISTGNYAPANRPDLIKPIKYLKGTSGKPGAYWMDPTSFADPPYVPSGSVSHAATYTRLGTLGRNQVFGPGYKVVNWSVQKNIHLTDKETLELHGDAFNLFNSAEFTNPMETCLMGTSA